MKTSSTICRKLIVTNQLKTDLEEVLYLTLLRRQVGPTHDQVNIFELSMLLPDQHLLPLLQEIKTIPRKNLLKKVPCRQLLKVQLPATKELRYFDNHHHPLLRRLQEDHNHYNRNNSNNSSNHNNSNCRLNFSVNSSLAKANSHTRLTSCS